MQDKTTSELTVSRITWEVWDRCWNKDSTEIAQYLYPAPITIREIKLNHICLMKEETIWLWEARLSLLLSVHVNLALCINILQPSRLVIISPDTAKEHLGQSAQRGRSFLMPVFWHCWPLKGLVLPSDEAVIFPSGRTEDHVAHHAFCWSCAGLEY